MILRRVRQKRERVVNRPQGEDRRVGKVGVSKSETTRRFVVDRATVKRYCKQLDKRGTLEPSSAPTKIPKVDEKARKLLVESLKQRPWAAHPQRAEFLNTLLRVRVSEATVCRALGLTLPLLELLDDLALLLGLGRSFGGLHAGGGIPPLPLRNLVARLARREDVYPSRLVFSPFTQRARRARNRWYGRAID
jgi:transposase